MKKLSEIIRKIEHTDSQIHQIYEEGKMTEEYLIETKTGVKNGFYKRYEFDKLIEEGNYKDGVKQGIWKKYHVSLSYYENGKLIEEKHNVNSMYY